MTADYTLPINAQAVRHWCAGAAYLTACFPFVSPVPISLFDTQPLSLIFSLLLLLLMLVTNGIARRDVALLFFASASLVYLDPLGGYIGELGKYVALLGGVIILHAGRTVDSSLAYRLLRFSIVAYFIGSCLIMLAPDFFLGLQGRIVRGVNVVPGDPLGYRGVPTFATEPGLLGGLLVFFLIQLRMFAANAIGGIVERRVLFALVCATIFLTKSGTGYFYFILFLGVVTLQDRMRSVTGAVFALLLVSGLFAGVLALASALEIDNRGLELLAGLASGSTFGGEDTSVLKRLYDVAIGFASLKEYPFGAGGNMVIAAVNKVAFDYGLVRAVDYGTTLSLVSGLSWMLVAYGLAGLAFLLYLFLVYSKAPLINKLFALVFLTISYSPAFPAIWILLAQTKVNGKVRPNLTAQGSVQDGQDGGEQLPSNKSDRYPGVN
jgi:hypothetical protein